MKTTAKTRAVIFLVLIMCTFMNGCKSSLPKEHAIKKTTDSAIATVPERKETEPLETKEAGTVPLILTINNLASSTAPVVVGVYGTKNKFPDPKDQLKEYKFKPTGKVLTVKITDLKFGTYALAVYQDVNSNGKINKNVIGIPTEPYAFSHNYKPRIKAPDFNDCKFEYNAKNHSLTINMLR